MGLWTSFLSLVTGTDLAAEQARSDAADAKISQLNQTLVDQGYWTQTQYDTAQSDIASSDATGGMNDVTGSVVTEFEAGAKEGLNNVLDAPGKVVGAVGGSAGQLLWGIVKNIPWWLYVGAAVALFVWMGGLELLRGKLGKVAK